MNSLKKVLAQDDLSKYKNKKNNQTLLNIKRTHNSNSNATSLNESKRNNMTDINQLIQCRTAYKKSLDITVTQKIKSFIRKSFQQNKMVIPILIFTQSLSSIVAQYYPDQQIDRSKAIYNEKQQKVNNLVQLLQKILQNQKDSLISIPKKQDFFINNLETTLSEVKKYFDQLIRSRKEKQLEDYEKIIKILKPPLKKKQEKRQNIKNINNKLLNSISSGNLHIKVTTQQIQIKNIDTDKSIKRKRSQGNIFDISSTPKINTQKVQGLSKNQGQIKLQNFLKDNNVKIVKTKVEYDYSAILQASKFNVQSRNKTIQPDFTKKSQINSIEPVNKNKLQVTNINSAKKDQAFVFYRPKAAKNSNK